MAENDLEYLNALADEPEVEEAEAPEAEVEQAEPEAEEAEAPEAEVEEETETEGAGAAPVSEEPVRRRAETRIQKLANERTAEREARIRAEAERDALLKFRPQAPVDNTAALRERQERLQLMEPQERAIFLQNEQLQAMQNQLALAEFRAEDRSDKSAYDSRALVDPRYARHKDSVEKMVLEYRAKNVFIRREDALEKILGRELLNAKPRKSTREAAGKRVESVQGKPTTVRGNSTSSAGKGDDLASLEARLRGKSFSSMFGN
jgi:hypothetical protein